MLYFLLINIRNIGSYIASIFSSGVLRNGWNEYPRYLATFLRLYLHAWVSTCFSLYTMMQLENLMNTQPKKIAVNIIIMKHEDVC